LLQHYASIFLKRIFLHSYNVAKILQQYFAIFLQCCNLAMKYFCNVAAIFLCYMESFFWNSSNDVIDSITRDSYHFSKLDERKNIIIHNFFVLTLLFARLSPDSNSPLKAMFILMLPCFWITSRTRSTIFLTFEELAKLNVPWVYHGTGQYTAFERCFDFTPSESRVVRSTPTCTKRSRFENLVLESFILSSRAIRVVSNYLISIDNRTFNMILCFQRFDEIIPTLFPRKKLFSHIQLSDLRYEIYLHALFDSYYYNILFFH